MLEQERQHASQAPQATTASTSAPGERAGGRSALSTPPSLSLPKGGGAVRGIGEKFAANPVTGTATMAIPIETSPGRSGFGPNLSLTYDSSAGNTAFGYGWNLSLPRITRKTDQGLPRYLDDDEFILSGAEDLIPAYRKDADGNWIFDADGRHALDETVRDGYRVRRYRPRIEAEFARIERWTRIADGDIHWRTFTRENVVVLYGLTANSRIADPEDARRVFSWLACESYDDRGNALINEYAAEDSRGIDLSQVHERNRNDALRSANRHLKRIRYGNRTPNRDANWQATSAAALNVNDWMFEVVFDYGEAHYDALPAAPGQHRFVRATHESATPWAVRPDPFSSYRAGFEVRTYRRCRRVLMFHRFAELGAEPCLVRSTEFDYADMAIDATTAINAELAHQGSTRFASFIRAAWQSGYRRDANQPPVVADGSTYVTYLKKSMPPIEFSYSKAMIDDTLREVDPASLENLPYGVDGTNYQWADLDGEGSPGILTEQAEAWFYKRNLSAAYSEPHFGPAELVMEKPNRSLSGTSGGASTLLDLAGDGTLDLVSFSGRAPGFFERTEDNDKGPSWGPFKPFTQLPNAAWNDPNLRFVDLNGDGHADVLITQDEVFVWHASLAEEGFDAGRRVGISGNEEAGPRLVFSDGTQSVYLADMSGDGLSDLVRVSNGDVCYWPNLGYGRFGAKVAMDNTPRFDTAEQFDQRRVRIADIDGSGVSDLIYLGADGVDIYFNQSGNRLSDARRLAQFPQIEEISSVLATDLLGNGTACLVWSSPLPANRSRPMRYIDLMGGQKPHLLTRVENNLGAETHIQYAPSTRFYVEDKLAGKPWITKLPFPVHVVERIDTYDRIGRNRFVTRYAYHHGYFDGDEREFRGFGMVEQWDTEEFAALNADDRFPDAVNIDVASHSPPVLTRTWFHTGVYLGRDHVSNFFAGLFGPHDTGEYYREPGLTDAEARRLLVNDTVLPEGLTVEEEREACRALKGTMLRQEVYALDGTPQAVHPYTVTEQNFGIRVLQPEDRNPHAAMLVFPLETLDYRYERNPTDPRLSHMLTLETDDFGNVRRAASIGYGRRQPDLTLDVRERAKQAEITITYSERDFTNAVNSADDYHLPLQYEARSYHITGLTLPVGQNCFTVEDAANAGSAAVPIGYEVQPTLGVLQKRLIEHGRTLFRRNDLNGPLAPGVLESMAIAHESYTLAFTPAMTGALYGGRVTDAMLIEGGYVHSEGDSNWWLPSGRVFHSPGSNDTPAQELTHARAHFFLPQRFRDPFHTAVTPTETILTYDAYHLLMRESIDALGNRTTAGERNIDPTLPLVRDGNDYRLLKPMLIMDPNRNCSAMLCDALGMAVCTAVMGKPEEIPRPGDSLTGVNPDLTDAEVAAHLQDPFANPHGILQTASTRNIYDLFAFFNSKLQPEPVPVTMCNLVRETHASDLPALPPGEQSRLQHSFSYSDGLGRVIQRKLQAEAGADALVRWIGTGWVVQNNKGDPVRKYEPFFTDRHTFEFDVQVGVSPVFFYDPLARQIGALHPNHAWEKIVFSPWRQEAWDVSDTVLIANPATDADVGPWFARLQTAEYLPTWHGARQGGALGAEEQAAANKTAIHAATPTVAHGDSLGRTVLTITHNRYKYSNSPPAEPPQESFHALRYTLDIESNQREVIDAFDRVIMRYGFDMLGKQVHRISMEAGERWSLHDVTDRPLYSWDSRTHRIRTGYDALRRPSAAFLQTGAGTEQQFSSMTYGESQPNPETLNLRGREFQVFDQAGIVTNEAYDFKGNLLNYARRLTADYQNTIDWTTPAAVALEADVFTNGTRYDALNRPIEMTTPDNSTVRPRYNEANLLEAIEANLRGAQLNGQLVWTPFIDDIDYDAKGQRTHVAYGNGVTTDYAYDPFTFRLTHLLTLRGSAALQDLHYICDSRGNPTYIRDDAQQDIYFRNRRVEPSADFTYDALGHLIESTGREHLGQIGGTPIPPIPHSHGDGSRTGLAWSSNDGNAMGSYIERYVFDLVGNLMSMQHQGSDPVAPGWRRNYAYNEVSAIDPLQVNNRLSNTTLDNGVTFERYRHDAHGNITRMPHLANHADPNATNLHWDFLDRVRRIDLGGGGTAYYTYDDHGKRLRKVLERAPGLVEERIYLNGMELFRSHNGVGAITLERETLHIMDDEQRIAMVETRTQGIDPAPARLIRYQYANHLGSAALELDDAGQIVSYEEYSAFGSTTYQAVRNQTDTPKRYRYTGKERDEESGLYYHGARYLAPWLGRWISTDPVGLEDGVDLYVYVKNNPVRYNDPTGAQGETVLRIAQGVLGFITADVAIPEPTDVAWPKWAAYGVAAAAAGTTIYFLSREKPEPVTIPVPVPIPVPLPTPEEPKPEPKPQPKPEPPKPQPKPEPKPEPKPQPRPQPKPRPRPRPPPPQPKPKPKTKPDETVDPIPDPGPDPKPEPKPDPKPDPDEEEKKPKLGRVYVTYTKVNKDTNLTYSGRTSAVVDLTKPILPQAVAAVAARDTGHHKTKEGYGPAVIDKYSVGSAVDYTKRYDDKAYFEIRGREQQMIDHYGGSWSDTGKPHKTGNDVRGVAKDHSHARQFHDAATARFGELNKYTGN